MHRFVPTIYGAGGLGCGYSCIATRVIYKTITPLDTVTCNDPKDKPCEESALIAYILEDIFFAQIFVMSLYSGVITTFQAAGTITLHRR